jgi:quinol-cytochrome oxidoreductase complex cytochrome b subunit
VLRHVPRLAAVLIVLALLIVVLSVPFLDRRERESVVGKGIRWLLGVSAIAAWLILAFQQYRS